MKRQVGAVGVLLLALFAECAFAESAPPSEASRRAELSTALQAAGQAGTKGPADVSLIDQAALKLSTGDLFVPKEEGARLLRAFGNVVSETSFVGLVVGQYQNDLSIVVIRHVRDGYIKDDDAKSWNADDLLKNLKSSTEEANKDLVARGFPERQVIGWVEAPHYDAVTHRLVWSVLGADKGAPSDTPKNINYNTYALGRDGYFSLNLLSDSDRISGEKAFAHRLLAALAYNDGKRYEDFNASTDSIAEYGLAALIGGIAAKKLGLFALAIAFVLKFAKVIFAGAAMVGIGVIKFFRRKTRDDKTADRPLDAPDAA
ncbi:MULTISPECIES: DUF2167 domain-containing protein [Afipia]|nr:MULTISPECIES: DUF2167 domain-containing protein [Afipia]MCR6736094.1 DUF2167 domain-containing protein [Afipia sp.]